MSDYIKKEKLIKELENVGAILDSNVLSLRCLESEGYRYDQEQYVRYVLSLSVVTESLSQRLNELISKLYEESH